MVRKTKIKIVGVVVKMFVPKFILVWFLFIQKTNSQKCPLPSNPRFGSWSFINKPTDYATGLQVPANTILEIKCQESHTLEGARIVACINGTWIPSIGRCLQTCPSIYSTSILEVTCIYGNEERINCTDSIQGTLAEFKCKPYYEDPRFSKSKAICLDGKWSEKVPECTPVCGRAALKKTPTLIVRGEITKKGDFPWQIALYRVVDKELICGGTLLSERIVLTAAHCVTDSEGNLDANNQYIIVAGKYYRKFDHSEDLNYTQVSEIYDIYVPEQYRGDEQNFMADIAIMVTKRTLTFSDRVQPACIDWSRKYESVVVSSGNQKGYVSGWGYTKQNSQPSNELRSLMVPSIKSKNCREILPYEYRRFMTYDKFCAGYRDNGSSVCQGDSGGGLVFKKEGRFFIAGVVSLSPLATSEEGGCDSQQYSLYTLIYNYTDDFILRKMAEHKISETVDKKCENCNETSNTTEKPNTTPSATEATPQASCPSLSDSSIMKVTCTHSTTKLKNCGKALDGTVAKFECSEPYEFSSYVSTPTICLNGNWSYIPECVPSCGTLPSNDSYLKNRFPWHVAIYKKLKNEKFSLFGLYSQNSPPAIELRCEGVLIKPSVVLTAAQCMTDSGQSLSKEDYIIAAAKYHEEYQHLEDKNAQFAKIESVKNPDSARIKSATRLIMLDKPFVLSSEVQPVCIYYGPNIKPTNREAFVSNWTSDKFYRRKVHLLSEKNCTNVLKINPPLYHSIQATETVCTNFVTKVGGGLFVKRGYKYYLEGVLIAHVGDDDSELHGFYSNITFYRQDILVAEILPY